MMDEGIFAGISFPSPIEKTFSKVISIGWYDGTTSGLALDSPCSQAFRFDLVDWGPGQELRVFSLSPIAVPDFEQTVKLYNKFETPIWPIWYPRWPSAPLEQERMGLELDSILARAETPGGVFASQSRFETILAAKRLTEPARAFMPVEGDEFFGDFGYWQKYLELSI
jgi:hypothetical protein